MRHSGIELLPPSIGIHVDLETEVYQTQSAGWPRDGQRVLAHYDDVSIIVYQAYRRSIGSFAIEHGRLGGPDFSFTRMSWIKPNFLWMMYRSGWGTKEGQEITLALRLRRKFFDELIEQAVPSSYDSGYPGDRETWSAAVARSEVRSQWDPDHAPSGVRLARRAIQLGLRGGMLQRFAESEILQVIDMSAFVESQRVNVGQEDLCCLRTPLERVYVPAAATRDPALNTSERS